MELKINIQKKHLYFLSLLIVVVGGVLFVQGYNTQQPSVFGHTSDENHIIVNNNTYLLGTWIKQNLCRADGTNCPNSGGGGSGGGVSACGSYDVGDNWKVWNSCTYSTGIGKNVNYYSGTQYMQVTCATTNSTNFNSTANGEWFVMARPIGTVDGGTGNWWWSESTWSNCV